MENPVPRSAAAPVALACVSAAAGIVAVAALNGVGWPTWVAIAVGCVAVAVSVLGRLRYHHDLFVAVVGFGALVGIVCGVVEPLRALVGDPEPIPAGLLLMGVAATALPFVPGDARTPRGWTAVWGQGAVLVGVAASALSGVAGLWIAALGMALVLLARAGVGAWLRMWLGYLRSGVRPTSWAVHPIRRDKPSGTLAKVLSDRFGGDQPWRVMADRTAPDSDLRMDALLVGPPGVVVVTRVNWTGDVELRVDCNDAADYTLGGSAPQFVEELHQGWCAAQTVADRLAVDMSDVHLVMVVSAMVGLPEPVMRFQIDGLNMAVTHQQRVAEVICGYPHRVWREPRRRDRWGHRGTEDTLAAKVNTRFVTELGMVAERTFPRREAAR